MRFEARLAAERNQSIERAPNDKDHIAAFATIAAAWPAARDEFLAAKMDDAIAPFAALYMDFCFVIGCHNDEV